MAEDELNVLKFQLERIDDKVRQLKDTLDLGYHFAFKLAHRESHNGTEEYFKGVGQSMLEHLYNAKCCVEDIIDIELGGVAL